MSLKIYYHTVCFVNSVSNLEMKLHVFIVLPEQGNIHLSVPFCSSVLLPPVRPATDFMGNTENFYFSGAA